jgi:formylglycine-generating enzyme required for sulfatase activity
LTTTEDGTYYLNGAQTNAELLAVTRKANARYVIPSEDEWYKAAYYKCGGTTASYWDYPTRSNYAPGQDMNDASSNNANYYTEPYVVPIDSGHYTTVAGEFQNSDSPYGTFDQGGNVFEWNEAVTIIGSAIRGLRGGYYASYDNSLLASSRYSDIPTNEFSNMGFRVSAVPEPSSLIALAAGLGSLLAFRRRRV